MYTSRVFENRALIEPIPGDSNWNSLVEAYRDKDSLFLKKEKKKKKDQLPSDNKDVRQKILLQKDNKFN